MQEFNSKEFKDKIFSVSSYFSDDVDVMLTNSSTSLVPYIIGVLAPISYTNIFNYITFMHYSYYSQE